MDDRADAGPAEELPVRLLPGSGEPERFLLLARPMAGRVRVREWTSDSWGGPAAERELPAATLLDELRRADRARRLVDVELHRVERWLEGPSA